MDQKQVNQTYEVFSKLQFVSGTCADAENIKLTRQNKAKQNKSKNKKQKTEMYVLGDLNLSYSY